MDLYEIFPDLAIRFGKPALAKWWECLPIELKIVSLEDREKELDKIQSQIHNAIIDLRRGY